MSFIVQKATISLSAEKAAGVLVQGRVQSTKEE